jgi:hypothetical protein
VLLSILLAGVLVSTAPAVAQAVVMDTATPPAGQGWDAFRAVELVRRAQERRSITLQDTALVNYQSAARAFVYFYLDREDTGERNLIKTDQVALEVFWQAPDQVKQRIVGWRDQRTLPTRIHYHIDHLSVVQENFGDEIRIGDGDEVRGVPHPAAPGSERFYQFNLVDSLTLRLPGAAEPVQVYQLQVRPRDASQPAIVGSVFIDRRAGDLVRMDFTFTAASYVDRYLDYINISLDNGLWRGRFWLPNEQRVELRRRLPMLDFPAGTIIRANMRVGEYEFNQPLPPLTFVGPPIVTVPREEREAFPFEEEIFAELREQGLGPAMELGEIREMARQLARRQALETMGAVRLRAGGVSDVLRFNRAEGLALGFGGAVHPRPGVRVSGFAGYAFGAGHPLGRLSLGGGDLATWLEAGVYANQPADFGAWPAASGLGNTLAAAFAGRDYTDLFFRTGAEAVLSHRFTPLWTARLGVTAERQRFGGGSDVSSGLGGGDFRPRLGVSEGGFLGGEAVLARSAPHGAARWWDGEARVRGGFQGECLLESCERGVSGDARNFLRPVLRARTGWHLPVRAAELELEGRGGAAGGVLPVQEMYWLGGRGTVPGFDFRSLAGERYLLARAAASMELDPTWLRLRALGAAGAVGGGPAASGSGFRSSLGLGLGILHDILHVELHRGLGADGRWELIVESNRGFWDFL